MTGLSVFKAIKEKPVYKSDFEILTKAVTAENEVVSTVPQTLGKGSEVNQGDDTLDKTKIKVLLSPSLLNPVVNGLKRKYPSLSYEDLSKNLDIESKDKNILTVGFSNVRPAEVKDVLNMVCTNLFKVQLRGTVVKTSARVFYSSISSYPNLRHRLTLSRQDCKSCV